jgi:hypothetical protein
MSDIIEAKAESNGVARIKASVLMADRPAWTAAIDSYILVLQDSLAADQAMLALDQQALALATVAKNAVESDTLAYAQVYGAVKTALTVGSSDKSISGVLASFSAPYSDKYSKHIIYTNYVSKANYNKQQLVDRITRCQASIATLTSLRF